MTWKRSFLNKSGSSDSAFFNEVATNSFHVEGEGPGPGGRSMVVSSSALRPLPV